MTELLPKPKRDDYYYDYQFDAAERDYYKRLAEFAIAAMERSLQMGLWSLSENEIKKALSTIKQGDL